MLASPLRSASCCSWPHEAAFELCTVGGFTGSITIERNCVTNAVATTIGIIFTGVWPGCTGSGKNAAVSGVAVAVKADQVSSVLVRVNVNAVNNSVGILGVTCIGAFVVAQQVLVVGAVSTDNSGIQVTSSISGNACFPLADGVAVAAMEGGIIAE